LRALDGRLDGNYLIGVFGHGPADLSIVQWRSGRVRPLTHVSAANLSGSQLDRVVLVGALGRLMEQQRNVVDPMLLSDLDWLWLQRNVESTRRSLCTHDRVTLELPSSMTDGQALELEFDRETVRQQVRSVIMEFTAVLRQCCTEANLGVEQLQGCLVSGGLLWQLDVLDQLNEQCGNLPVIPYPPDAQMLGAHRRIAAILTETTQPESEGTPVNSKPLPKLEHRHIACGTTFPIDQKHDQPSEPSLDAFVQRISDLIRSGKSDEAKVELRPLQECIHTLESSLASAEQARSAQSETDRLLGLARTVTIVSSGQPEAQIIATDDSPEQSLEIPPRGDSATPPVAPVAKAAESKDEKSAKRAERRKYIRAKEELKKAQDALNKGQLEQAVGLSHAAYEQSADHRIFDAMIKVHLIAASKRPPHDSNFADERRWLLCALNDDTTREDTQQAIADRYKIHVRQLVDMGTREARRHAIEMLRDLSNVIPMPELAEHWLQILKEATSEKVQLPEEVPGASA
nr:Hsp70 family protein [Planctomycetota bacterium]